MTVVEGEESAQPRMMRGVAKHTAVYAIGIMARQLASVVLLPVYTRYLSPADDGVLALIELALDFAQIFAGTQILAGVARFYHAAETEHERRATVSTAMIGLILGYAVIATLVQLGAGTLDMLLFETEDRTELIRIAAVTMAVQPLSMAALLYAQITERSTLFVSVGLFRLFGQIGLNLFFLIGMGMGPEGVLWAALIVDGTTGIGLAAWMVRTVGIRFSKHALRKLVAFGLPMIGASLSGFAYTFADRFFLVRAGDEAIVGLYQLAYKFGFIMMMGLSPFMSIWGPKRFSFEKREDRHRLLADGFRYGSLLLITAGVGIAIFVRPAIRIMSEESFHSAAAVVPVILMAYLFHGWANIQDLGILIRERTSRLAAAHVLGAVVALVGYWLFIPSLLAWGAALATVLSFSARWGLTYWISQRLWHVEYEWRPILILLALAVASVVTVNLLSPDALIPSIAFRVVLMLAYLAAVWFSGVVRPAERVQALEVARAIPMRIRALLGAAAP